MPAWQALTLTYLWLGRNIYMDVAFFARAAFEASINESYLTWNMPYWLAFDETNHETSARQQHSRTSRSDRLCRSDHSGHSDRSVLRTLRIYNMDVPLLRYRIHEGNYLNSKLGAANVLSGELRCLLKLAAHVHIPAYRLQFYLYRLLNKIKRDFPYRPLAYAQRQRKLSPILRLVFEKAADPDLAKLPPYKALLSFFEHRDAGSGPASLTLSPLPTDFTAPYGNQMRSYNRRCIEDRLSDADLAILELVSQGPSQIRCSAADYTQLSRYLRYLGLDEHLELVVE